MSVIENVLAVDSKYRTVGVTGDIHTIDTLISDLSLDYDTPTMCNKYSIEHPTILLSSRKKFKKKFNEKYPFLQKINMENLLIAGGSISSIVRNVSYGDSDIDFFIYGLNETQATERVKEWLIDILVPKEEEHDEENEENNTTKKPKAREYAYKIIRNKNSIAILLDDHYKIQLIFRLYKSISEILHGFDLGSSALGYDGDNIYFTTLGKFCHEYSCNIIDTTRRSTTYEYRLKKYFDRGFNIVLPKLDITKLRTEYFKYNETEVCEMPYFIFGYSNIVGNKIFITRFYNKFTSDSDYDLEPINPSNAYYQSFTINIVNLLNGIDHFYYVSSHVDENTTDILANPPRINKGSIVTFYDNLREKLSKKNIDVNLIKRFITVEPVETVISKMFDKNINTKTYFDELMERQKSLADQKLNVMLKQDHSKIQWITENPGTQLTSSFNPIIEQESLWYGNRYYKMS